MRARLTTCLSALLLFHAIFTVPVARVDTNRVSCSAVYSERRRHRAEQLSEAPAPPRHAAPAFVAGPMRAGATVPLLDSSLFQRPPPALSL
ncbi:MAG: hypothetical protein ABSH50_19200 [Bryobacteraceae bacterium]